MAGNVSFGNYCIAREGYICLYNNKLKASFMGYFLVLVVLVQRGQLVSDDLSSVLRRKVSESDDEKINATFLLLNFEYSRILVRMRTTGHSVGMCVYVYQEGPAPKPNMFLFSLKKKNKVYD